MTTILDVVADLDRVNGKPTLTPRWEATLRAFYGLPMREVDLDNLTAATRRTKEAWRALAKERGRNRKQFRELWARVGRRGRKSFTMALVAVFEAAFGGHERYLVPGEQGLIAIVSKDTAGSTLVARFCELHAQALGFETNWSSIGSIRVLELSGVAFSIACFPCNAKAPRGFAIPVIIADEIAVWSTDDDSAQNDESVLSAIKPAQAQFPNSKLLAISSAFGKDGQHYETIEANLGYSETADPNVLAVEGPTWEWNPDISEARTHELEKNKATHDREYRSIPPDTVSGAFDGDAVRATFTPRAPLGNPAHSGWVALDPSSLRGDGFGVLCGTTTDREELVITGAGEYPPTAPLRTIVDRVSDLAKSLNTNVVFSDQREEAALRLLFEEKGIELKSYAWSEPSKAESVAVISRWMSENRLIVIPAREHLHATGNGENTRESGPARLLREMLSIKAKLMPSGKVLYSTTGADVASCLISLAHAAAKGDFSPGETMNPVFVALKKAADERDRSEPIGGPSPSDTYQPAGSQIADSLYRQWAQSQGYGRGY